MDRRKFGQGLLVAAACGNCLAMRAMAQPMVQPSNPAAGNGWTIPSGEKIRRLLAERIDVQRQGVGIVVGTISPAGQAIIAHGASGAPDGRPLDGDTVFQVGSVSKAFVTLLLSDMVLRDEVKLNDPAQKYLPIGVTMPELGRQVTLQDLATHMSGLPSMPTNFDLKAKPNPVEAYTTQQWYEFLSFYQLSREPGTKLEYSNQGVALLGHLLALRAGETYERLVTARIMRPLGMISTSIRLSPRQRRRLAPGHDMYRRPVDSWEMRTLQASGSMRSTAGDLLTFLAAYLGYRDTPLKAAMAFQTSQPKPPGSSTNQSLGLVILPSAAGPVYFHDGGKEGYRSLIAFCPQARSGVVVLANARSEDNIIALGLHLLSGRSMPPAKVAPPAPPSRDAVLLPRKLLDSYEGRYLLAPDKVIAIACLGERLLMDVLGDGISEFFASGEQEYFSRTSDAQITLQMGRFGRVTELILREGGKEQICVRL